MTGAVEVNAIDGDAALIVDKLWHLGAERAADQGRRENKNKGAMFHMVKGFASSSSNETGMRSSEIVLEIAICGLPGRARSGGRTRERVVLAGKTMPY